MDSVSKMTTKKTKRDNFSLPQQTFSSHSKRKIKPKVIEDLEYQTPKISNKKKRFSAKKAISTAYRTTTSNKGPWTDQEDKKLIELVEKNGPEKWSFISSFFPDRIGKQCRERWFNHLNPTVKKSSWLKEEEWILFLMHKSLGNKWSKLCEFLPGRTDNTIKNHWNSTMQKKLKEFNEEYTKLILDKNKDEIITIENNLIQQCKDVIKDDNEKFYDEKYKNYEKFKNCKIENRQTASKLKKLLLFRTHSKKTKKRGRKRKYIQKNNSDEYLSNEIKKRKVDKFEEDEQQQLKNHVNNVDINISIIDSNNKNDKNDNNENNQNFVNININKNNNQKNYHIKENLVKLTMPTINELPNDFNNLSISQEFFPNYNNNSITKNYLNSSSNKKLLTPIKDNSYNKSNEIKQFTSERRLEKIERSAFHPRQFFNDNEFTNIKGHLVFNSSIKKSVKTQRIISDDNLINNDNFNNLNRLYEQNENMTPNKPYDCFSYSDTFQKNLNNKYLFTSNNKFDDCNFNLFGNFMGNSPFKANENINLENIFSIAMQNDYAATPLKK